MMPYSIGEQLDVFINRIIETGLTYNSQFLKVYLHMLLSDLVYISAQTSNPNHSIKLGLIWGKRKHMPKQEHFISNLIRQKLFSAIDRLDAPEANAKKFFYFFHREDYEIGLLFAHYLITKAGHNNV